MPDYTAKETAAEFKAATERPAPEPQATVTLQLETALVGWFQTHQPEGMTWQADINSVLRGYVENFHAMEAAAPHREPYDIEANFIP